MIPMLKALRAPSGKWVEIRIIGLPTKKCTNGCVFAAMEPKVLADKRMTNPRYCCEDQLDKSREQISELNPTPIFSHSNNDDSEFTFEYKYI
ncbi:hypothetical protein COOONC_07809 [Cooperia oncophora]